MWSLPALTIFRRKPPSAPSATSQAPAPAVSAVAQAAIASAQPPPNAPPPAPLTPASHQSGQGPMGEGDPHALPRINSRVSIASESENGEEGEEPQEDPPTPVSRVSGPPVLARVGSNESIGSIHSVNTDNENEGDENEGDELDSPLPAPPRRPASPPASPRSQSSLRSSVPSINSALPASPPGSPRSLSLSRNASLSSNGSAAVPPPPPAPPPPGVPVPPPPGAAAPLVPETVQDTPRDYFGVSLRAPKEREQSLPEKAVRGLGVLILSAVSYPITHLVVPVGAAAIATVDNCIGQGNPDPILESTANAVETATKVVEAGKSLLWNGTTDNDVTAIYPSLPPNNSGVSSYNPNSSDEIREELESREADPLNKNPLYSKKDDRGNFTYSLDRETSRILFKKEICNEDGNPIAGKTEYFCLRLFSKDGTKEVTEIKSMKKAANILIEAMLSDDNFAKALDEHDLVSLTISDPDGDTPSVSVRLFSYQNRIYDRNGKSTGGWNDAEAPFGRDWLGRLAKPSSITKGEEFKFSGEMGKKLRDAGREGASEIKGGKSAKSNKAAELEPAALGEQDEHGKPVREQFLEARRRDDNYENDNKHGDEIQPDPDAFD